MKKLLLLISVLVMELDLIAMEGPGESTKPEVSEGGEITLAEVDVDLMAMLPFDVIKEHILTKLSPKDRGKFLMALGNKEKFLKLLQEEKDKYLSEKILATIDYWSAANKVIELLGQIKRIDKNTGFVMLKNLIHGIQGMTFGGGRLTLQELNDLKEIVTTLIGKGASVNEKGYPLLVNFMSILAFYKTAWGEEHEVAKNIVKQLIDAGADVNEQDEEDGETPLMAAVAWDNLPLAQMLLDAGADTNLTNNNKKTAADLAVSEEIKQMILEKQKEQEAKTTEAEGKQEK